MTEPTPDLQDALQHVAAAWDEARTARTLQGAQRKRATRRTRARVVAAAAGVCVLAALGYLAVASKRQQDVADGWHARLELADGSRAFVRDEQSQVVVARVAPGLTELQLLRGSARFDVAHDPARRFRVYAGDVVVQVLGTAFEITRSASNTHVAVTRGRVAVTWPGGSTELAAGEARWFSGGQNASAAAPAAPAQPEPTAPERPTAERDARASGADAGRPARAKEALSWRQHAEQGDFKRAFALLSDERARVADDVEELLLAADAARLSGHASEALPYLRKVVDVHTDDPRAPLAAFTLGSVLMNQLGRPREAESAYAKARSLAPRGSLAQDALARQVEAAHRAGDPGRAHALALEYLQRHPDGRRVEAVRRFGGLP